MSTKVRKQIYIEPELFMPRDYTLYLEDIVAAIDKVAHYLQGVTFDEFAGDSMRLDRV